VDSRVVGRLEHDTLLGGIHFIYTERSVASNNITSSTLLSHSVGHEKCLVSLLSTEPKLGKNMIVKRNKKVPTFR